MNGQTRNTSSTPSRNGSMESGLRRSPRTASTPERAARFAVRLIARTRVFRALRPAATCRPTLPVAPVSRIIAASDGAVLLSTLEALATRRPAVRRESVADGTDPELMKAGDHLVDRPSGLDDHHGQSGSLIAQRPQQGVLAGCPACAAR